MLAAAPTPPISISVELCVSFEQTVALENLWIFQGTRWQVTDLAIIVEAAFDPAFAFPIIPPTTLALPNVNGAVGPFDGVIDQGGTSGEAVFQTTQALVTATLAVADPTYFAQPWPVYIRTSTVPWTQQSASPAMVFTSSAQAGAGLVVTFLP